jgi:hypothetical protein
MEAGVSQLRHVGLPHAHLHEKAEIQAHVMEIASNLFHHVVDPVEFPRLSRRARHLDLAATANVPDGRAAFFYHCAIPAEWR